MSLLEQVLNGLTLHRGAYHLCTLSAKGDLAAVLFELGHDEAAALMEREAFERPGHILEILIQ